MTDLEQLVHDALLVRWNEWGYEGQDVDIALIARIAVEVIRGDLPDDVSVCVCGSGMDPETWQEMLSEIDRLRKIERLAATAHSDGTMEP